MINDEEILIISSLLHDIGKVKNRTNKRTKHQDLSAEFVNDNLFVNDPEKIILNLVKYHHTDENYLPEGLKEDEKFIKLLNILKEADKISAIHEREQKENEETIRFLRKIFDEIKVNIENKENNIKEFLPPVTLNKFNEMLKDLTKNLESDIFDFRDEGIREYKDILNELEKYFKDFNLYDLSTNRYKINTLNSILMVTTRFVPSAFYYSEPNVPLYDHLKMTAAIALIIYRTMEKEKKIILIHGDIIGVQRYIFRYFKSSTADDKGTKRLRGRSFTIKIINDSIINYILDELDLYQFNILFDSSDKFFIIAPYSDENINKLKKIRENVERFLYDKYRDINLSLVWKEESIDILTKGNLGDFIQSLIDDANKRKYEILSDVKLNENLFILNKESNNLCEKCGIRYAVKNNSCEICEMEENIGETLVKIKNIYRTDTPISDTFLSFEFDNDRKYYYNFDKNLLEKSEKLKKLEIISINDFSYEPNNLTLKNDVQISWRPILQGNYVPKIGNNAKSINNLVCFSEDKDRACSYVGVLKGDVDNMGQILRYGFNSSSNDYNFTKYSAFSFFMNLYFTLIINKIAEKNDIYIAYSGGDDLVAIGEINQIISFTKDLNYTFRKWVRNPGITFSAGIAMVDSGYPIWRAIKKAEEYLEKSKKGSKNKITIFDETLNWGHMDNDEFELYLNISEDIYNAIKNENLSRGFLYYLLDLADYSPNEKIYPRSPKKIKIPDPYLNYYLARNWKKDENYEKFKDKILKNFDHISFSTLVTILKIRKDELEKVKER
ncbi:MAG: type III-A CRISPR-associated protein Cas10/Csm1 [Minisyncoccia bacterium]